MENNILKALEPYSRSVLISVIWGKESQNKYRVKMSRRLSGKVPFTELELEKLKLFLEQQSINIKKTLEVWKP